MYEAKQAGKGRFVVSPQSQWVGPTLRELPRELPRTIEADTANGVGADPIG
jgi:hypothetical protein